MKTTAKSHVALLLAGILTLFLLWGCNKNGAGGAGESGTAETAAGSPEAAPDAEQKVPVPDRILYLKDGEVWLTDPAGTAARQITQGLAANLDLYYEDQLRYMARLFADYGFITFTEDGASLFYPVFNEDTLKNGYDLYVRDLRSADAEPTPVAEKVIAYRASSDGGKVVYKSGGEAYSLGLWNAAGGTSEILADGDLFGFALSDDGRAVYYLQDGELKLKRDGEEAFTVDRNVDDVLYANRDFTRLTYLKNNCIFNWRGGEQTDLIATGVKSVWYEDGLTSVCVTKTGGVYYLRDETFVSLREFVTDRYAEADAATDAPGEESDHASAEAYADAVRAYREKQSRDAARRILAGDGSRIVPCSTFCYFDGAGETVLAKRVYTLGESLYTPGGDLPSCILGDVYLQPDVSDLSAGAQDRESLLENVGTVISGYGEPTRYSPKGDWRGILLAVGGSAYPDAADAIGSLDGGSLYYAAPSEDGSDVFRFDGGADGVTGPILCMHTDRAIREMGFALDGDVFWFDGDYTEWKNNAPFSDPVYSDWQDRFDGDTVWSIREEALYVFDGTKKTLVSAGAVETFSLLPDGAAYFSLTSPNEGTGEVCVWRGGTAVKLADGVTALIPADGRGPVNVQYACGSVNALYYMTQR